MLDRLKFWLQDLPTTALGHVVALALILLTGLVVVVRLACGKIFPGGYDAWLTLLAALAGVSTIGMIGKRLTDREYRAAGTSPVNVGGPSTVNVTTETPAPDAAKLTPTASEDPDK